MNETNSIQHNSESDIKIKFKRNKPAMVKLESSISKLKTEQQKKNYLF